MIKKIVDRYHWEARVAPGLILALPVLVVTVYAAPILSNWPIFATSGAFGVALLYGWGYVVGARGSATESKLWDGWDGPPSTRLMRHRDGTIGEETKSSIRQALANRFLSHLPSPEKEAADPRLADKVISDSFREVRAYLRKHDPDGLWFQHNVEYGFSRNLLACRGLWVVIASIATAIAAFYGARTGRGIVNPASAICLLSLLCAVWVGWYVLPTATKHSADEYAESAWMAFLEANRETSVMRSSFPE